MQHLQIMKFRSEQVVKISFMCFPFSFDHLLYTHEALLFK